MVATIGSMVHGQQSLARTAVLHVGGGALGGALTGFLAGAAGAGLYRVAPALRSSAEVVLVAVMAACAAHMVLGKGRSAGLRRQTPKAWRSTLGPAPLAFFYGADLGLGWSTRIYSASFFAVGAVAILSGNAFAGALVVAAFGSGRAVLAVVAARREPTVERMDRIRDAKPAVVVLNVFAMAAVAVLALTTTSNMYLPIGG